MKNSNNRKEEMAENSKMWKHGDYTVFSNEKSGWRLLRKGGHVSDYPIFDSAAEAAQVAHEESFEVPSELDNWDLIRD